MNAEKISWEAAIVWLKNQPDKTELVRACYFDDPLIDASKRYYESPEWQAVRAFLPKKTGAALDIGAGRGISSYALARDGWETTALEPDQSSIVGAEAIRTLAKETGFSIRVEEKWGENLPFEDETFDIVHGRQVLHHAGDLYKLCSEVGRVLKKGGIFIATREHVISRHEDLELFLANHPLHHLYGGENAYLLQDYVKSIKSAKLKLLKILGPYDSVINFVPITLEEMKNNYTAFIKSKLGEKLGEFFSSNFFYKRYLNIMSMRDNNPGRLYSFIAEKQG